MNFRTLTLTLTLALSHFVGEGNLMAEGNAMSTTSSLVYKDLRGYLDAVEQLGELRVVNGADWDLELGAITAHSRNPDHIDVSG